MKQENFSTTTLENLFERCLNAMDEKRKLMKLKGVAVVAFTNNLENWTSKMKVCGALKNDYVNFLSVAYSKAGEMADTLQNSGHTDRRPLLGEHGFFGGVIKKLQNSYVLTVFSGASGEDDTIIAEVGLQAFSEVDEISLL